MLRSVLSRRAASCLPAAPALFKLSPVSSTPVRSFSSGVSPNAPKTVTGEPYAQSLDFRYASVGMPLEVPYNMTMTAADRIAHQSSFYEFNRIATSRDFAGNLGFADIPMPFGLLLSHAGAMSHVDTSRDVWDLGFRNAVYVHPVFPGDTLSKSFYIQSIRSTSDGSGTVVCIRCELFTQEGRLAFSLDKLMLVTGVTNPYAASAAATAAAAASVGEPVAAASLAGGDASKAAGSKSAPPRSSMREQIISNAQALSFPSTRPLVPSQCILHVPVTPLGTSRHLDFCNRFRLTHPLHVNLQRHSAADLVAPGLAVISLVHAASNRALFEVLHESVLRADFLNKVAPGEAVGAVTFVQSVTELPTGASGRVSGLADVTAVTLGIKNTDVVQELAATPLPVELFTQDMRPSVLEAFVEERVPQLKGKIVTRSVRSLLRQSLFSREEQIPLL